MEGAALYEWVVMPFGLTNAPPTFQRVLYEAMNGLEDCLEVYMDDLMIHSPSLAQHVGDLDRVLQRLRDKRLKAKRKKCEFGKQSIAFLGHVLGGGGIRVDPVKVEAARKWKLPLVTVKQVQQFLGFYVILSCLRASPRYCRSSSDRYVEEGSGGAVDIGGGGSGVGSDQCGDRSTNEAALAR